MTWQFSCDEQNHYIPFSIDGPHDCNRSENKSSGIESETDSTNSIEFVRNDGGWRTFGIPFYHSVNGKQLYINQQQLIQLIGCCHIDSDRGAEIFQSHFALLHFNYIAAKSNLVDFSIGIRHFIRLNALWFPVQKLNPVRNGSDNENEIIHSFEIFFLVLWYYDLNQESVRWSRFGCQFLAHLLFYRKRWKFGKLWNWLEWNFNLSIKAQNEKW